MAIVPIIEKELKGIHENLKELSIESADNYSLKDVLFILVIMSKKIEGLISIIRNELEELS